MKKTFLPFAVFAGIVLLAAVPLLKGKDPSVLSSALIEKPVPAFSVEGLSDQDLKNGKVSVINVFASWCVTCAAEQEWLEKISSIVPVYGLAYKDKKPDLEKWLSDHGNPFAAIGHDTDGRASIEWGVYGVPETFIVDGQGVIRYKHVGAIDQYSYNDVLKPLIEDLKK